DNSPEREHALRQCMETLLAQTSYSVTADDQGNVIAPLVAGGRLFGVAYLELNRPLSASDQQFLDLFALQCGAALENFQLFRQVEDAKDLVEAARHHAIYMLAVASEYKDQETGNHIQRISHYTRAIAEMLGWPVAECEAVAEASVLHDMGKMGIPDAVLQKPGRLTEEEFAIIRTHCSLGARILGEAPGFQLAHQIALYHHEKWNGTGYPAGLQGEAIPISARIVAVADVFDALVSERPYKKPWSVEAALAEIEASAGKHFDPDTITLLVASDRWHWVAGWETTLKPGK
ncbi:MAG: HD domain-containing protein, partial [Magnetococcus sp. XQGC-1]